MKKILFSLSSLALAGVVASGSALAAPAQKVDICHYDKDAGTYHRINVSQNAEPAHMRHGDAKPGDAVPGSNNSKKFTADCGQEVVQMTFTATDSSYYNGADANAPLYASGPVSFTWNPATGEVTGGMYDEMVPPTNGTVYHNIVQSGTVSGEDVTLTFTRTDPNSYGPFTFTGTLVNGVLSGQLDGPYFFTATGTVSP